MTASDGFKDFIKDQFALFGRLRIRNMFGGAGVYAGDAMIALIADDTLYLKADETTVPAFEAEGMRPFVYETEGRKPIAMSYWELPPRLLDEPEELAAWANEAHRVARAAKAKAKPKKTKAKPKKAKPKQARKTKTPRRASPKDAR